MKITITNDHPTPMEVLKAGVVLQPGQSIDIDVPDTEEKAAPAPAPTPSRKSAKNPEGDK